MRLPAVAQGVNPVRVQNLLLYRIVAFEAYPNLRHAIFTRQGGYSQSPFASLNLGLSVGDDPETVNKNYEQVCGALDISPDQTVSCHLIHSADVLTVDSANRRRVMGQADGLITATPGIYLSMRFGDCTPLIFFDPARGAVGLTHAGWRGTMQNAAGATVRAMIQEFDCRAGDIIAVIGPAIGPCCYEVGPEVIDAAATAFSHSASLFVRGNGRADRAHFNMWEANRRQLAAAGVEQIIQSELCTACRTDQFFSHRAEQGRTGRFGVIIGLQGNAV
ncbi:MAG: peptidoglycan editing factor PgeF [Anaerolineae bacterium]|nr:peptidoglycan editing factor PgeF [Anaerolineales bacterium]MCQ3974220.1 peptidoglycan editing factor PgeF [Anaerolineae bacterium]